MVKRRVLIVDDAKFMRLTLSNIFTKNGFEIVGVGENGEDAVRLYKETRPDIVTLDVTMPIIDGIEALKQIISFDKNAKVVMCSAMGQQKLVVEAIELGAKDFIVKPFDESRVINTINQILQNAEQVAEDEASEVSSNNNEEKLNNQQVEDKQSVQRPIQEPINQNMQTVTSPRQEGERKVRPTMNNQPSQARMPERERVERQQVHNTMQRQEKPRTNDERLSERNTVQQEDRRTELEQIMQRKQPIKQQREGQSIPIQQQGRTQDNFTNVKPPYTFRPDSDKQNMMQQPSKEAQERQTANAQKQPFSFNASSIEKSRYGEIPEYRPRTEQQEEMKDMKTEQKTNFEYVVPEYRPRKDQQVDEAIIKPTRKNNFEYVVPQYRPRNESEQKDKQIRSEQRIHAQSKQDETSRVQQAKPVQQSNLNLEQIDLSSYMNVPVKDQQIKTEHNFDNDMSTNIQTGENDARVSHEQADFVDVSFDLQKYLDRTVQYKRKEDKLSHVTTELLEYVSKPVLGDKHDNKLNRREAKIISIRGSDYLNRYTRGNENKVESPYTTKASNDYLKKYGINYNE